MKTGDDSLRKISCLGISVVLEMRGVRLEMRLAIWLISLMMLSPGGSIYELLCKLGLYCRGSLCWLEYTEGELEEGEESYSEDFESNVENSMSHNLDRRSKRQRI